MNPDEMFARFGLRSDATPPELDNKYRQMRKQIKADKPPEMTRILIELDYAHLDAHRYLATKPKYVAMIDVLGFRSLVGELSAEDLSKLLIKLGSASSILSVDHVQFSDSILLYTNGIYPGSLTRMVEACSRLLGKFAEARIPLRAGICGGDFLHLHHASPIFAGKAMIRAYDLEQMQDWMGGVLDPEIERSADAGTEDEIASLLQAGLLVRYDAPIRGGGVGSMLCLGWPKHCPGVTPPFRAQGPESWDVMRKRANTERFLAHYRALHQAAS